jgi:hypothetical protein
VGQLPHRGRFEIVLRPLEQITDLLDAVGEPLAEE